MSIYLRRWLFTLLATCGCASYTLADTITFGGEITQSTQDGTGPAVNNPDLNNIQSHRPPPTGPGDAYTVVLDFSGSITSAGTYDLTGSSLVFSDPAAPATEKNFDLISLTVSPDFGFYDLSLLGCLTTGSGCSFGNQLTANFQILATDLNSKIPVTPNELDQPHPLDLLEDDGATDIHGSITSYSYTSAETAVPEPSSMVLLGCTLAVVAWKSLRRFAGPRSRSWIDVKKRI